ncbi:MAG: DUF167 domain-containing protein [Pseudomonadota bacterium]
MAARDVQNLSHLARAGAVIAVRVSPGARQSGVRIADGTIRVAVAAVAEDGRATAAATALLAQALGVAKTRLVLLRGATSRDKLFRLD